MRLSCPAIACALLLAAGAAPCLFAAAENEAIARSASDEIAAFVTNAITRLDKPSIAIVPFRHEDGSKSMEGALIAERIMTELSLSPSIRIVEREALNKALEEQKLAQDGFISAETAAKTGKLTGARGILTGTITEMGSVVEVHARLFTVETGEILAAKKVRAQRSIKTFISPLWDDIDRIKAAGKEFKIKVWMENDHIRIGDAARVFFQADRDCHATIFDFSTDGSITILFPNKFQPNNAIKAGRRYELPPEDGGYKIRVRGPAGIERLKILATARDVPLYEKDYSQSPFSTLGDGDPALVRGLQVTMDGLDKTDWAESSCEFLIENVLR